MTGIIGGEYSLGWVRRQVIITTNYGKIVPRRLARVVFLEKKLFSTLSLFNQVYKWVPTIIMLGGNLAMD